MADELQAEGPGLSQIERVADTFFAPTKTFNDVLRSASWWLPYVLGAIPGLLLVAAVVQKVGYVALVDNQIQASPALQSKLATLTPDVVAKIHSGMIAQFKFFLWGAPLFSLVILLVVSVILWPAINFIFGGKATYPRVFSTLTYAYLPLSIKAAIVAVMLWAGVAAENFTLDNMLGTSIGFYVDAPGALKTFLTSFDIFTIWVLVLMSLGLAIVAGTKRSSGFITVIGLWFAWVLVTTGLKAVAG